MEIDEDLASRMRTIAARKAEVAREEEEARVEARQRIAELDKQLEDLRTTIEDLEEKREQLARFCGLPSSYDTPRLAHGALKELCFEALRNSDEGAMRTSEIKDWIEAHYPDVRTTSVPATLSRQAEYGSLVKDEFGRYRFR